MRAIAVKEFRELRRDRRALAMLFLMPILFLVVFGYAASYDIEHVPTVVVGPGAQAVASVLPAAFEVVSSDAGADCTSGGLPAMRAALDAAGVPAELASVPATLEETFVRLALAQRDTEPSDPERTSQ